METQLTYNEIKEQIRELLKKLPPASAAMPEAALIAFELQEELKKVLASRSKDVKKQIDTIAEKQKALDMLIDIGKKFRLIYEELTEDERKEINLRGASIRKHITEKNANSIKRGDDSGVHARPGEGS